jgi:hypothetical protein
VKKKLLFSILIILCLSKISFAQNWLDSLDNTSDSKTITSATFKSTRLINVHTIETLGKRTLDFRISHRFANINSGTYGAWGIDGPVNIRLDLEYSYDGRLMVGIGRTSSGFSSDGSMKKLLDGFLKYRLLRQTDDNKMPLSVTLFTGGYYTAEDYTLSDGSDKYAFLTSRLSFAHQLLIARKFSPKFSLEVNGWFVHYNLVDSFADKNDVYGVSALARYKFTKRSAVTFEYSYRINKYTNQKFYDSMGIGYELETGGHVFSVHLTNSFGLAETQFLPRTTTKWDDAGIRLGFNVSRVFHL